MNPESIARINELAKLAKERELTPAEQEERQTLRQQYVASVRESLTSQLDVTYFVSEDGKKEKLQKKESNPPEQ